MSWQNQGTEDWGLRAEKMGRWGDEKENIPIVQEDLIVRASCLHIPISEQDARTDGHTTRLRGAQRQRRSHYQSTKTGYSSEENKPFAHVQFLHSGSLFHAPIASLGLIMGVTFGLANLPAIAYSTTSSNAQTSQPYLSQTPLIAQTTAPAAQLFVNPNTGNDSSGNGSAQAPFKTITQALRAAPRNTVIFLAPGTYNTQTGETFPIELKPGVTLQGDPTSKGRNIAIVGGGFFLSRTFARQNIAVLGVNQSGLAGVTVTNPNRRGYGLWVESASPVVVDNTFIGNSHDGISVTGNSAPLIRNNYFAQNGANGITIYGTSRPELRDNVFEKTGFGINIAQNAAPLVIGNRVIQNQDGIVVQGKAQPVLRNNRIEGNKRDGLVAIAETFPDLGTAQNPGGNYFNNNGRYEINVKALSQPIPAFGNQIFSSRVIGRLDLAGTASVSEPRQVAATPLPASRNQERVTFNRQPPIPNSPPSSFPTPPPALPSQQPLRQANQRPIQSQFLSNQVPPASPSSTQTQAISIPVPPPESSAVSPLPQIQPPTAPRNTLPGFDVQPGLLPVPGAEIPRGNTTRRRRTAARNRATLSSPSVSSPAASPSRAAALGFRYRVVVVVRGNRQIRRVRSLVPGAFKTRTVGRRIVMQVGAYTDRAEAEAMLENMTSNGLSAKIEEL